MASVDPVRSKHNLEQVDFARNIITMTGGLATGILGVEVHILSIIGMCNCYILIKNILCCVGMDSWACCICDYDTVAMGRVGTCLDETGNGGPWCQSVFHGIALVSLRRRSIRSGIYLYSYIYSDNIKLFNYKFICRFDVAIHSVLDAVVWPGPRLRLKNL